MRSSDSLANMAPALVKAQAEMEAARKTANNPHLRQTYADLSDVWVAVKVPLNKNGIGVAQGVSGAVGEVTVTTRLLHTSGEWMEDSLTLPYVTNKGINEAQAAGSAISYARRYGLASMCSLPTEDDDGSSVGGVVAKISAEQVEALRALIVETESDEAKFCKWLRVDKLENLLETHYEAAEKALRKKQG